MTLGGTAGPGPGYIHLSNRYDLLLNLNHPTADFFSIILIAR